MTDEETAKYKHDVARWAAVSAFFGSLLSIGIVDVFNPPAVFELAGAVFVAGVTAGGVYAKQRLDDAKRERERERP